MLGKARNNMMRRETMFMKDSLPMLTGEPPQEVPPRVSAHEKVLLDKGCPRCQLFGCAKAFQDDSECDVFGKPTTRLHRQNVIIHFIRHMALKSITKCHDFCFK